MASESRWEMSPALLETAIPGPVLGQGGYRPRKWGPLGTVISRIGPREDEAGTKTQGLF